MTLYIPNQRHPQTQQLVTPALKWLRVEETGYYLKALQEQPYPKETTQVPFHYTFRQHCPNLLLNLHSQTDRQTRSPALLSVAQLRLHSSPQSVAAVVPLALYALPFLSCVIVSQPLFIWRAGQQGADIWSPVSQAPTLLLNKFVNMVKLISFPWCSYM